MQFLNWEPNFSDILDSFGVEIIMVLILPLITKIKDSCIRLIVPDGWSDFKMGKRIETNYRKITTEKFWKIFLGYCLDVVLGFFVVWGIFVGVLCAVDRLLTYNMDNAGNYWMIFIALIIVVVLIYWCYIRTATKKDIKDSLVFGGMGNIIITIGSVFLFRGKNIAIIVMGIIVGSWATLISLTIHYLIIRFHKKEIVMYKTIKYVFYSVICFYLNCFNSSNASNIYNGMLVAWMVMNIAEYILILIKTYDKNYVSIHTSTNGKEEITAVYENQTSYYYVTREHERKRVDKDSLIYITYPSMNPYKHYRFRKQKVYCEDYEGKKYWFNDYWIDSIGYMNVISIDGETIYIFPMEKVKTVKRIANYPGREN